MPYTSPTHTDIRLVIDTGVSDADLDAMIAMQEKLWNQRFATSSLSDDAHFEIVRWLSADSAWLRDPESRVSSLADDNIRETYSSANKLDQRTSPYFLRAIDFDTTGTLAAIAAAKPAAEFRVLG